MALHRSPVTAETLEMLLKSAHNISTLFYDCYLPSTSSPLDLNVLKQALQHVHATLTHLTIRYDIFANEALDASSLACVVTGTLGSLASFTSLTELHIPLGVLFGQVRPSEAPTLASVLPSRLQRLTISDDLWEFDVSYQWIEDGRIMAILAAFLEGVPGEEPSWKKATPELRVFVLDMRERGWILQLSKEDTAALRRMGKADGLSVRF